LRIAATAPSANDDAPATVEGGACSSGGTALRRPPRFGKNYRRALRLQELPLPDRSALELIDQADRGVDAAFIPVCDRYLGCAQRDRSKHAPKYSHEAFLIRIVTAQLCQ